MVKGRVFNKLKEKDQERNEKLLIITEDQPITEYRETLYAGSSKPKKEAYAFSQSMWRNVTAIEKNVDTIHKTNANKRSNDLERVVDRILAKKKK